jgi:hypothetical protein
MSRGFTGHDPRSVWCWYGVRAHGPGLLVAASHGLTRAFGPLTVRASGDPKVTFVVPRTADGWSVAAWLVSHAAHYRIREVRYGRYEWRAAKGTRGWTREPTTVPAGSVQMS